MNPLEITTFICDFCHEPINGEVIHPCRCEKYYHTNCLQHIIVLDKDPLIIQKCDICDSKFKTKYKSKNGYYIYKYFQINSKWVYYINAIFGILGIVVNLLLSNDYTTFFLGLSLGCISYSIILVILTYSLSRRPAGPHTPPALRRTHYLF